MRRRLAVLGAALVLALGGGGAAAASSSSSSHPKPTIVLVHGAFADSSGWNGVIQRLGHDGYPVVAMANPLRGVSSDAAQLEALLATVDGPVVLVGHSYGGMVISAVSDPKVKALVYLSAYAPKAGESAADLTGLYPGSTVVDALQPVPLPDGGTDLYVDRSKFNHDFAGDLPARQATLMGAEQRPVTAAALNEDAIGVQGWQRTRSYFLIGEGDLIIPPALQHFEAGRAHASVVSIKGASHVAFIAHPGTTTKLIERAAH